MIVGGTRECRRRSSNAGKRSASRDQCRQEAVLYQPYLTFPSPHRIASLDETRRDETRRDETTTRGQDARPFPIIHSPDDPQKLLPTGDEGAESTPFSMDTWARRVRESCLVTLCGMRKTSHAPQACGARVRVEGGEDRPWYTYPQQAEKLGRLRGAGVAGVGNPFGGGG